MELGVGQAGREAQFVAATVTSQCFHTTPPFVKLHYNAGTDQPMIDNLTMPAISEHRFLSNKLFRPFDEARWSEVEDLN